MPSRIIDRETSHRRGWILTCFVNGRKRFRTLTLDACPPARNDSVGAVGTMNRPRSQNTPD